MTYTNDIRSWMLEVLERRQWSQREWTRKAGVASTTLSRFLNQEATGYRFTPSVSTLRKLAEAADVPIPRMGTQKGATIMRVALTGEQFMHELQGSEENRVPSFNGQASLQPVIVETNTLDIISEGDVVFVEAMPFAQIEEGQVVMCVMEDLKSAVYYKSDDKLVPTNSRYAAITPTAEIVIGGRVNYVTKKLV